MIPSDYGKLDVINITISLLVPLLSFQIIEAIFRFAIDVRENQKGKNVFSNAFFFSFLVFFLSLCLYPLLKNIEIFAEYNVYFYTIFFLTILNRIVKQFTRGLGRVKLYVVSDILYSGGFAGSNAILLVLMKLGVRAYLLSNIIALSISILFLFIGGGLVKYLSLKFDKELLKKMLAYSIPLIPNGIMWWIVNTSDRYFLSYFIGYKATGIYSVAAKFPSLLTTLYAVFSQAWQLSAIEEYDKEGYTGFFRNIFGMLSSVMFLGSSVLFLLIKPFMKVYVGATYFESWRYTVFLFLGALFYTFASFYGVNYAASKKTIGAFSTSVIAAATKLAVILSLIKIWGIQAASVSTFFAYLVMWIARIFHTRQLVKVELDVKHVIFSFTPILIQAVLLLSLENNVLFYTIQACLLLIILWLQKKYISKAIKFSKKLIKARQVSLNSNNE